jgi:pilus assembly protein CpaE
MTVFLCASGAGADKIGFTLGEEIQLSPNFRDAVRCIDGDLAEQLVIIGPDVPMSVVRDLTDSYRISRPTLGAVLIRRRLDVATMNEALQVGVREVVAFDDAEGLIEACRRSLDISRKLSEISGLSGATIQRSGKIVLIFSAKGGCGKTTLSVNLAQALAQDPFTNVCVVDFDLQFGDVAVALHIEPTKNISNILNSNHIDQLSLRSVLFNKEKNLDLLLAPNNPADVELINADLASAILNNLKQMYDYIVIDSPPAFTDVILKAFDLADTCVLLTTLDMPAIKNLRVSMQTLRSLGLPEELCNIVVNRSDSKAGLTVDDVEDAVGKKVLARIPTSIDVPATTNKGLTIVQKYPKHKVSKEIFRISETVRELTNGKRRPVKRSWFRRKKS